jgi:hypothetical protein
MWATVGALGQRFFGAFSAEVDPGSAQENATKQKGRERIPIHLKRDVL